MRLRTVAATLAFVCAAAALGLVGVAWLSVERAARGRIFAAEVAPERRVAIVFGAAAGSSLLRDRVQTGVALYRAGKVRHLLLSGDNRRRSYDEPRAMRRMAIEGGVPEGAIVLDYAGRRTYDSCARARDVFQVGREGSAILVTQEFHLARALYLCRALGFDDVVGVPADRAAYRAGRVFAAREVFADVRAWLDVHVRHPPVVGGRAEPIGDDDGDSG